MNFFFCPFLGNQIKALSVHVDGFAPIRDIPLASSGVQLFHLTPLNGGGGDVSSSYLSGRGGGGGGGKVGGGGAGSGGNSSVAAEWAAVALETGQRQAQMLGSGQTQERNTYSSAVKSTGMKRGLGLVVELTGMALHARRIQHGSSNRDGGGNKSSAALGLRNLGTVTVRTNVRYQNRTTSAVEMLWLHPPPTPSFNKNKFNSSTPLSGLSGAKEDKDDDDDDDGENGLRGFLSATPPNARHAPSSTSSSKSTTTKAAATALQQRQHEIKHDSTNHNNGGSEGEDDDAGTTTTVVPMATTSIQRIEAGGEAYVPAPVLVAGLLRFREAQSDDDGHNGAKSNDDNENCDNSGTSEDGDDDDEEYVVLFSALKLGLTIQRFRDSQFACVEGFVPQQKKNQQVTTPSSSSAGGNNNETSSQEPSFLSSSSSSSSADPVPTVGTISAVGTAVGDNKSNAATDVVSGVCAAVATFPLRGKRVRRAPRKGDLIVGIGSDGVVLSSYLSTVELLKHAPRPVAIAFRPMMKGGQRLRQVGGDGKMGSPPIGTDFKSVALLPGLFDPRLREGLRHTPALDLVRSSG